MPAHSINTELSSTQRGELHDTLYAAGSEHMAWATRSPPDASTHQRVVRAAELFERASAARPDSQPALVALGQVRQSLGEHEAAYAAFTSALAIEPHDVAVWAELCGECLALGRADEAVQAGQRAVELAPDSAGLRANLALAYLHAERLPDALGAVTEAVARDPSDPRIAELSQAVERAAAQSPGAPTPAPPD